MRGTPFAKEVINRGKDLAAGLHKPLRAGARPEQSRGCQRKIMCTGKAVACKLGQWRKEFMRGVAEVDHVPVQVGLIGQPYGQCAHDVGKVGCQLHIIFKHQPE